MVHTTGGSEKTDGVFSGLCSLSSSREERIRECGLGTNDLPSVQPTLLTQDSGVLSLSLSVHTHTALAAYT